MTTAGHDCPGRGRCESLTRCRCPAYVAGAMDIALHAQILTFFRAVEALAAEAILLAAQRAPTPETPHHTMAHTPETPSSRGTYRGTYRRRSWDAERKARQRAAKPEHYRTY